jgi:hypothetical protein
LAGEEREIGGPAVGEGSPGPPEPAARSATEGKLTDVAIRRVRGAADWLTFERLAAIVAPLAGAIIAFWLIVPTLMSSVGGWDTAEFQAVLSVLGTGHPTGYPSYVILGFIATKVLPFGNDAYRVNLLQAILAAGVVGLLVATVQYLTGMRMAALAAGLALLVMPGWSSYIARIPNGSAYETTPFFWRIATHADYHMLHLFLLALVFLLLLVWQRWRTSLDGQRRRRSNRVLIAAAIVYGVAFANHGLSWLAAPGIALFLIAVAPRILLERRLILTCAAFMFATIAILYAELPIRAAMDAPLVYAHPDTLKGFLYVALGQQFGGSLVDPFGALGTKLGVIVNQLVSWLGPVGYLAAIGVMTSLVRRPAFVLLAVAASLPMAFFAASYYNADLERYYLVPLFVAMTFVGLGLADAVSLSIWFVQVNWNGDRGETRGAQGGAGAGIEAAEKATTDQATEHAAAEPTAAGDELGRIAAGPSLDGTFSRGNPWWPVLLAAEAAVALAVVVASLTVTPVRAARSGSESGAVSLAGMSRDTWLNSMLAPADKGGLPPNAIVVSWWSDSTTLWYGQKVEGLRPDIYIIDDSMRVPAGDNLGSVSSIVDRYLATRPIFLDRQQGGGDGLDQLSRQFNLQDYSLPNGIKLPQVMSKKGS